MAKDKLKCLVMTTVAGVPGRQPKLADRWHPGPDSVADN
jgi:hypothetical protein